MRRDRLALAGSGLLGVWEPPGLPPLDPISRVDLQRFMADGYVVDHIPTFPQRDAWISVECYKVSRDGSAATPSTRRENGLDGEPRHIAVFWRYAVGKLRAVPQRWEGT
jgi:apolipoprotein D and lipocalin family protein